MRPAVDLLAIGFLAGLTVGIVLTYALHVSAVARIERRHAFGLKRHPSFR